MNDIKIHPIPIFLENKFPKSRMTYLFNLNRDMNIYCTTWLIENSRTKLLVDTGGTAEMAIARGSPPEELTTIQSIREGLAKYSLEPSDIDTIIITHLHWDHIALANEFVNAKFLIQSDEINFARSPHPVAAMIYEKDLLEGLHFEVIKGDSQITDGVRVLLTPGHTPGSQSIQLETKAGTVVITGFCCIQENFEPEKEIRSITPVIIPGVHLNFIQAYESMLRIKQVADLIIPLHESKFATIDTVP